MLVGRDVTFPRPAADARDANVADQPHGEQYADFNFPVQAELGLHTPPRSVL